MDVRFGKDIQEQLNTRAERDGHCPETGQESPERGMRQGMVFRFVADWLATKTGGLTH